MPDPVAMPCAACMTETDDGSTLACTGEWMCTHCYGEHLVNGCTECQKDMDGEEKSDA